jgi:hypothetical protein
LQNKTKQNKKQPNTINNNKKQDINFEQGMAVNAYNASTWKAEAGRSKVQSSLELRIVRLCFKKPTNQASKQNQNQKSRAKGTRF